MKKALLFIILILPIMVQSQKIIPTDSTASIPFDFGGITSYAEESSLAIKSITEDLLSEKSSYKLMKEYEVSYGKYLSLRADTNMETVEEYTLWVLTDLTLLWNKYENDIAKHKEQINRLAERYQEEYNKLSLLDKKWGVTIDARPDDTPEKIEERINTIQSDIALNEKWIEDSLGLTLDRYNIILQAYNELLVSKSFIKDLTDNKRHVIFSEDAPPLTKAIKEYKGDTGLFKQIWLSSKKILKDLRSFLKSNKKKVEWQIVWFLLIIALFYYFRFLNRKHQTEHTESTEQAIYLINRPLAVGLVFAIFLSFWYYSSPPPLITQLLFLAFLIPIIYLTKGIVKRRYRTEIFFILGVYTLNFLGEFMPAFPLTQRLIILLLSVTTGVYSLYILYHLSKQENNTTYKKWTYRIAFVYAIFSAVAVYSNLIGSLSLARLLTRTIILSAALGMILLMCYTILGSLLSFFIQSNNGKQLNLIRLSGPEIMKKTLFYIKIFFIYLFINNFLTNLYISVYVRDLWDELMELGKQFGDVYLSIGQVIDFILILFIFSIVSAALRALIEVEILPRTKVKKGIPMAVGMFTRYAILLLGFLMATSAAGLSLDKVGFIIGALGVGIGFGLQKLVGNFISGIILVLERPVRVGDIVTASETEGTIMKIGLRASTIRDWNGAEVIIPNNDLITMKVTNWTFSDSDRRSELLIRVEPDSDPNKVIEICKSIMTEHLDVKKFPKPMVLFKGFKEFYLEFRVLFFVSQNILQATSDVNLGIFENLSKAGIKIPIPKQEWLEKSEKENKQRETSKSKDVSKKENDQLLED